MSIFMTRRPYTGAYGTVFNHSNEDFWDPYLGYDRPETNMMPIQYEDPFKRLCSTRSKGYFPERNPFFYCQPEDDPVFMPNRRHLRANQRRQRHPKKRDLREQKIPVQVIREPSHTDECQEAVNDVAKIPVERSISESSMQQRSDSHSEEQPSTELKSIEVPIHRTESDEDDPVSSECDEMSSTEEVELEVKHGDAPEENQESTIANDARRSITSVCEDLEKLDAEVDLFSGSRKEKTFLRLEHELTSKLLTLDRVSAAGTAHENEIRSDRKAAVIKVQTILDKLENNVA